MTRLLATAATLVAIGALTATWYLGRADQSELSCAGSQAGADLGGPFDLVNAAGQTVTDQDVIQEPTLIYFGYTFCPDVCPLHISRNADAVDLLAERGIAVTPVFITIDPERDTPDIVGDFASNLHDKMIGLTGSAEQIAAASKAYRTYYKAHNDGSDEYLVDHSTFTYLTLPDVGFVDFYRGDATAEAIADRVACFAANA